MLKLADYKFNTILKLYQCYIEFDARAVFKIAYIVAGAKLTR